MQIIMPDNTEFHPDGFGGTDEESHLDNRAHVALHKGDHAMAIDPPIGRLPTADDLKQYSPGPQLLSLEHLTAKLKQAEATAATLPALRAELAERMAAMFPGQKLVKARKAKGGAK